MGVQELEGIDSSYLFTSCDSVLIKPILFKHKRTVKSGNYVLPQELRDSPVKGKVFCGGCNHNMYRQWYRNKGIYYFCTYSNTLGIEKCSHGVIYEVEIVNVVLEAINQQYMQLKNIMEIIQTKKDNFEKEQQYNKGEIIKITNQINALKIRKKELLTDFQLGKISDTEYVKNKVNIIDKLNNLNKSMNYFENIQENGTDNGKQDMDLFYSEEPVKILTKEIVERMVDRIEIYNHKKIQVVFKYQDVFDKLLKEC